jgi:hypothetical protein
MSQKRHTSLPLLVLLGSALVLAACGAGETSSSSGTSAAPSAESTAKGAPAVATPTEKICGAVDRAAVAALLDVPEGSVTIFDGIAGEEMTRSDGSTLLDKDGNPTIRPATICDITNKQRTDVFTLSFFDAKTSSEKAKSYAQNQKEFIAFSEEEGAVCGTVQDLGFGEPSWGEHCTGFEGGFGSLSVSGVFGPTVVTCSLYANAKGDPAAKVKPAKTICADAVKAIAG